MNKKPEIKKPTSSSQLIKVKVERSNAHTDQVIKEANTFLEKMKQKYA
jgi:hypothetical protein